MTGERGVSTALGYVITLVITTVLISGLMLAGGTFVENQREQAVRTELTVVGHQLASSIETADRLARTTGPDGQVRVRQTLPETVAGNTYSISVTSIDATTYLILFDAQSVSANVTMRVNSRTPVDTSLSSDGGSVVVALNETTGELEVRND